jgi:hypothetical protein
MLFHTRCEPTIGWLLPNTEDRRGVADGAAAGCIIAAA